MMPWQGGPSSPTVAGTPDKGNAEAHFALRQLYEHGKKSLKKSPKQA
jgi:hypothetical protein